MSIGIGTTETAIALLAVAGLALACAEARADDEAVPATPAALAARTSEATQPTPATQPLDLRPPDIAQLYSRHDLEKLIAKMEAESLERVEVEGARVPVPMSTPRVWPAIAAPFWALLHPTQAWRIFAPIPPDQARDIGNQKADTVGYLEPIGVPPGDPFKQ